MRLALALAPLLFLAGCAKPQVAGDHFLVDGPDANVEGFADLLWADWRELNGSLALIMEFENMSGRIPEFTATFELEGAAGATTWFLRTQENRSRPPALIDYVVGRVDKNEYVVVDQVCALTEVTRGPWLIRVEAEHRLTGFEDQGGRVKGLSIRTSDFEGTPMDFAETSATLELRGGKNPHAQCPLHAERPE